MNVKEYRYDYAGNRIAKITELNTINYLVDTNGALSQVLAEYDENGSLKTYYTRGAELISQEKNGVKSYYLYDGFDSVRILTDEDGTATDFYTFDAFGNLTDSTGDTENSYLYRGEQYDSFTGLYYLRARYMNPATGTFITMDEYAGSVFEPVSLHKYLYANANPVMYSDPSGYSSLSEMATTCAVSSVLCGIINEGICLLRFFFDDSFSLDAYSGNLTLAMLDSFVQGAYAGFIFGGFGYIAAHSILVSTVMIAFCGYSVWQNYSSALEKDAKGNSGGAWIDSTLGAMSVIGAFSFTYSAYNQFQAWAASRNPCGKGITLKSSMPEPIKVSSDDIYNLPYHFRTHGRDMGYGSKKQYNAAAHDFAEKSQTNPMAKIIEGNLSTHDGTIGPLQRAITVGDKTVVIDVKTGKIMNFYTGDDNTALIHKNRIW